MSEPGLTDLFTLVSVTVTVTIDGELLTFFQARRLAEM